MKSKRIPAVMVGVAVLAVSVLAVLGGRAIDAQDTSQAKYSVRVPNGLAFSEFRGYESWQTISISHNEKLMAVILGNPAMIKAYQSGIPGNRKPFPDGAKMAKIHWTPTKQRALRQYDGAGHPARRGLHGEGQQAVRGQRRMGMGRVHVRCRVRHVHTGQHVRTAAAGERRQVRLRVPHHREEERLRVHGLREAVSKSRAWRDVT